MMTNKLKDLQVSKDFFNNKEVVSTLIRTLHILFVRW